MQVTEQGALYRGRFLPCALGRGGIRADKREGDGATPAGPLRLLAGLYRADRITRPNSCLPLRPIGPRDLWSDDARDSDYNQLVRAPHGFSHEALRRPDPLYDLVLISDWNWPDASPGRGSAIFVHSWRKPRHPTEGCIAFAPKHLRWIVQNWQADDYIMVRP